MAVIWIERKNGVRTVTRVDYETGDKKSVGRYVAGKEPQRQLSRSNGIVGTLATLRAAQKRDAELGVSINYVKTHEKVGADGKKRCAWRAEFDSRSHKNNWLRKNERVDFDAGYSDPCPGDFADRYPHECV
jgi:hypothetical protein